MKYEERREADPEDSVEAIAGSKKLIGAVAEADVERLLSVC